MTLEEAKNLSYGDVLYHATFTNSNGTPQRWKVNGYGKVWKTQPNRILYPLKRGLREFGYLVNEGNVDGFRLDEFCLTEEEANYLREQDYSDLNPMTNLRRI